jgi:hypothetical protein
VSAKDAEVGSGGINPVERLSLRRFVLDNFGCTENLAGAATSKAKFLDRRDR